MHLKLLKQNLHEKELEQEINPAQTCQEDYRNLISERNTYGLWKAPLREHSEPYPMASVQ